jgi:hypothetical protein
MQILDLIKEIEKKVTFYSNIISRLKMLIFSTLFLHSFFFHFNGYSILNAANNGNDTFMLFLLRFTINSIDFVNIEIVKLMFEKKKHSFFV